MKLLRIVQNLKESDQALLLRSASSSSLHLSRGDFLAPETA